MDMKTAYEVLKETGVYPEDFISMASVGGVEKAMETYAKQQAIAFASWIALHGYRPAPTDTVLAGAWVMMKHRQDFTSDELYEKFKKEQQS